MVLSRASLTFVCTSGSPWYIEIFSTMNIFSHFHSLYFCHHSQIVLYKMMCCDWRLLLSWNPQMLCEYFNQRIFFFTCNLYCQFFPQTFFYFLYINVVLSIFILLAFFLSIFTVYYFIFSTIMNLFNRRDILVMHYFILIFNLRSISTFTNNYIFATNNYRWFVLS